jgi:hypothetical protein
MSIAENMNLRVLGATADCINGIQRPIGCILRLRGQGNYGAAEESGDNSVTH